MSNTPINLLCSLLIIVSCAHQEKPRPAINLNPLDYSGAASTVKRYKDLINNCIEHDSTYVANYNKYSNIVWWWNFSTAAGGIIGETVAGFLSSIDSTEDAKYVGLGTTLALGVSFGLKQASEIGSRLSEARRNYEKHNALVAHSITSFSQIREDLKSSDPDVKDAAMSKLSGLISFLELGCP